MLNHKLYSLKVSEETYVNEFIKEVKDIVAHLASAKELT